MTKILGRDTLKFGVDSRLYLTDWANNGTARRNDFQFRHRVPRAGRTRNPQATEAMHSPAFLLGLPSSGSIAITDAFTAPQIYFAPYLEDDIRVTSKLTLQLGLRWDVQTGRWETHNRLSYFNPNAPSPLASQVGIPGLRGGLEFPNVGGNPRDQQATGWKDVGPRFGLAWKVAPHTVIRGGYTITYLPITMRYMYSSNEGFSATTPFFSSSDGITPVGMFSNPFPGGVIQPAGSVNGLLTNIGNSLNTLLYSDPPGYAQNWSFGLQHELPGNVLLEASYAGSKGTKLPMPVALNTLPAQYLSLGNALLTQVPNPFKPFVGSGALSAATVAEQQLLLPFPQFLGIADGTMDLGSSTYHSLLLKATKRFSHGFSLLASYTNGKLLTDTSGDGAIAASRCHPRFSEPIQPPCGQIIGAGGHLAAICVELHMGVADRARKSSAVPRAEGRGFALRELAGERYHNDFHRTASGDHQFSADNFRSDAAEQQWTKPGEIRGRYQPLERVLHYHRILGARTLSVWRHRTDAAERTSARVQEFRPVRVQELPRD